MMRLPLLLFLLYARERSDASTVEIKNDVVEPSNSNDPDYYFPAARGGEVNQSGHGGMAVFLAPINMLHDESRVFQSSYFFTEDKQQFVVPGWDGKKNNNTAPYGHRELRIKLYGGGGGGCSGGRGKNVDPSAPRYDIETNQTFWSQGSAGSFVEAIFLLPIGAKLEVTLGGGGKTEGSQSDSLAGKGGHNAGQNAYDDGISGGGGGGGLSTISFTWNDGANQDKEASEIVLMAAWGGRGGGNTLYCSAKGGSPGILRGMSEELGGYVNETWVAPSKLPKPTAPGPVFATKLAHESAAFTWNAGSHQASKDWYVDRYTVYKSTANATKDEIICSESFSIHSHIQRSANANATTELNDLDPQATYCLLVEAFSKEGLSLGNELYPFRTKPAPTNNWLPVSIRRPVSNDYAHNSSAWCQRSTKMPSGRRGHSMSVVNGQVYIFGGATVKCNCHFDLIQDQERCSTKNVFSNELWHFDAASSEFMLIESITTDESEIPHGREQHSLTVLPDNSMILIGGVSSDDKEMLIDSNSTVLGDVWKLSNPHNTTSHVIGGGTSELIPGIITELNLTVSPDSFEDLCIRDLKVEITLELGCARDLDYIALVGHRNSSLVRESKLFVSSADSRNKNCNEETWSFTFSEDAADSILSYPGATSGEFQPAGSLRSFEGLPIAEEWILIISQLESRHNHTTKSFVTDWKLYVDVQPCHAKAKWEKLDPNPSLPPRRGHRAVAVGKCIFVFGGYGRRNDLWRLDLDTLTWTELKAKRTQKKLPLQSALLLSPYGIITYGTLQPGGHRERGHDLWMFDFITNEWTIVPISTETALPRNRYLASIGLLNRTDLIQAVMFGGDNGFTTSFFDDTWILSLALAEPSQTFKSDTCDFMLVPDSTARQAWNRSCGWTRNEEQQSQSPQDCDIFTVLTLAWCMGQYQSV